MKNRVLLGMSGGVDSTIAAVLLQEQGYEVVGLTYSLWQYNKDVVDEDQFKQHIKELVGKLNIQHYFLDIRDEFKTTVVDKFVDDYLNGFTPFPCVVCNNKVKWKLLAHEAEKLGCDHMAMGHYAQIVYYNDLAYVTKGIDDYKDQSFFLWNVHEKYLKKVIFPLGRLNKTEIYNIAQRYDFKSLLTKKESTGVCFLNGADYFKFLNEQLNKRGIHISSGNFINVKGEILGRHKGFAAYTIGQHKGLGDGLNNRYYVLKINPQNNTVVLGNKKDLFVKQIKAENVYFINPGEISETEEYEIKIRYRSQLSHGKIGLYGNNMQIVLNEPVDSVAPGQSVVIYKNNRLLGGGEISF